MATFILRGIDAGIMERLKTTAALKGWTVKRVILQAVEDYISTEGTK